MKLFIACALLAVCLFSGCEETPQAVKDLQAIKAMFQEFRSAMTVRMGAEAAPLVSSATAERFDQFRGWAVSDTPEQLKTRTLVEQIETLRLRHLLTQEELSTSDGRQVVALLINRGKLPVPLVKDAILAEPVFKEDICYIQVHDAGGPAKEKLTFVREGKQWKIDLVSMEFMTEDLYRTMARRKQMTPDEIVSTIVHSWSPDIDLSSLWRPVEPGRDG